MRLIDADALKNEWVYIDGIPAVTERDIDSAPTIEAIPLEWLTKRMGEELEKAVLIGGEHNALSRSLWNVVEYWRREAKA